MRRILVLIMLIAVVNAVDAQDAQILTGTRTGAQAVRIAVPEFQPGANDPATANLTQVFNKVLWDDLDYSGVVTLVSRSFYPLGKFANPGDVMPDAWTVPAIDAQFVAFGNGRVNGNRFSVEARLWDLKNPQNREVKPPSARYGSESTEEGARLIAHQFADAIVELIGGGLRGIARTKIAYISDGGNSKELYVMDYDGSDAHALTSFKSITLTPAWSPDGEKLAFTTYRRGAPDIEIVSRLDRRPYAFERAGGTTTTPAWSPDGSKIAFATSRDGSDMEIYIADWNGKNMRRLTVTKGVDISPIWNPRTGREIAFVSDRSGSAQIYIMDAEGTNVRRIVEGGGTAVNPAWSPDGQRIAFAWQKSRTSYFDIYVHDLASGRNDQLTQNEGNNEKPTWAPDGRHLAFESNRGGTSQIFSMLADGTKVRRLTQTGKNSGPAWSGYIEH
jgi:TolB protein